MTKFKWKLNFPVMFQYSFRNLKIKSMNKANVLNSLSQSNTRKMSKDKKTDWTKCCVFSWQCKNIFRWYVYKLFLARIHNQSVFFTPVTCMHKFEYITRNAKYNIMIYSHVSKSFVCRKQHFFLLLFFKIYQMLCYGLKTDWNSHLNNYYFVFVVVFFLD